MSKVICVLGIIMIFFSGCIGFSTNNPQEAFKYWTRQGLPENHVKVLKGQYWQSGHFTLEYIVYLKLIVSEEWKQELIKLNSLEIDTISSALPTYTFSDVPDWFDIPSNYIEYQSNIENLHLWTSLSGDTIYIFNSQL